jgi:tripartite-type tricarboxylate transporter receptor subunit TctC
MSSTSNPHSRRAGVAVGLLMLALPGLALAQGTYPERPITLIVPFAPGGIADITARTVAQAMSGTQKQPIVIDNRRSAGSTWT